MDYNHVTLFLEKFKKILFHKEASLSIIVEIITKHISSPISADLVQIRGTTIHIKGSPMLRNEILIHKDGILSDINNLLPQSRFNEIR